MTQLVMASRSHWLSQDFSLDDNQEIVSRNTIACAWNKRISYDRTGEILMMFLPHDSCDCIGRVLCPVRKRMLHRPMLISPTPRYSFRQLSALLVTRTRFRNIPFIGNLLRHLSDRHLSDLVKRPTPLRQGDRGCANIGYVR